LGKPQFFLNLAVVEMIPCFTMKYSLIAILVLFLFSCTQEKELYNEINLKEAEVRLNQYWDLYEAHKADRPDSALHYMQEVKSLSEATGNTEWLAAAYGAIADIQRKEGKLGESTFYYLKAIKLFKELGELKLVARNYSNLALIYEQIEDYKKAIFYSRQAMDVFFYEGNSYDKANTYRNLALYNLHLGQLQKAEEYVRQAEEVALKAKDYNLLSKIYNTAGIVKFKKEQYSRARENYRMALQYSDSIDDAQWVKAATTNNIFEAYFFEKNYEKAEEWLHKASTLKEEINNPVFLQSTLNLYAGMLMEQGKNRETVELLQENFNRTDLSKVNPAIDEGLSLAQEALSRIAAENKAENTAYISRNFAALNAYSKEYSTQARLLRDELQNFSQQLAVQANADKYSQQEMAEAAAKQAAEKNLCIILLSFFLLACLSAALVRLLRKNRRYKKLYEKVETILNSQALRHMKKG
jgi:tetratricopeptide (TPR) repeat protein